MIPVGQEEDATSGQTPQVPDTVQKAVGLGQVEQGSHHEHEHHQQQVQAEHGDG